jgi:hypothetical protein
MPIQRDREYRTRSGNAVKLFTVNARDSHYPVVGEIETKSGDWDLTSWTADGKFMRTKNESPLDLVCVSYAANLSAASREAAVK